MPTKLMGSRWYGNMKIAMELLECRDLRLQCNMSCLVIDFRLGGKHRNHLTHMVGFINAMHAREKNIYPHIIMCIYQHVIYIYIHIYLNIYDLYIYIYRIIYIYIYMYIISNLCNAIISTTARLRPTRACCSGAVAGT